MIPLYIGVELILSFAILNKAGGAYGILSIVTGHEMNFWQWIYDLLAVTMLPFYLSALLGLLEKPSNIRKTCLACSIYIIDTFIGLLYTIYFVYFWFSRNDSAAVSSSALKTVSNPGKVAEILGRATVDLSQSASPSRELFLTISGTLITTAIRLYFCVVFISFTKLLLLQGLQSKKSYRTDSISEEAHYAPNFVGNVKKFVYGLEVRSKEFLEEHLIGST